MNGAELKPGFGATLRGVWLFTWRSRLTWRRLPLRLTLLLVLPVIVALTATPSRGRFSRGALPNDPTVHLERLGRTYERVGIELQPEQWEVLQTIFAEEFARMPQQPRVSGSSDTDTGDSVEDVRACYERIGKRVQDVLDEDQLAEFNRLAERRIRSAERRAGERKWDQTTAYYRWMMDFYFFMILPLACVVASGALIRDELQADTLGFMLTRPVSRARLLVAKYLCQTAWLQMLLLVESLFLVGAGSYQRVTGLGAFVPLFLGTQVLAIFAWSALGVFFGQVTKRYMALALIYGLIVEKGIGSIPTNINTLSLMRHLKTLLAHHQSLQALFGWSGDGVWAAVGALVLAAALFLGLAAVLFTFLEYHHTREMQR